MRELLETKFGSHLYGMSTQESDMDYKSIIIPDFDFIISEKKWSDFKSTGSSTEKNSCDDVDKESYSLHKFLQLAYAGDTTAIDMLHATKDSTLKSSEEWEFLKTNRQKFYTKNMKAYIGYCRKQAAKYCLKGSRLDSIEKVLEVLVRHDQELRVVDILDKLTPLRNEYIEFVDGYYKKDKWIEKPTMLVCGSKYEYLSKIKEVVGSLTKKLEAFGERSKKAKNNEGVDFKALHHALRAGYQAENIFKYGDFEYPLQETSFLMDVKRGVVDFEDVKNTLENLVDRVMILSEKSKLPEVVDVRFFEKFKEDVYRQSIVCTTPYPKLDKDLSKREFERLYLCDFSENP